MNDLVSVIIPVYNVASYVQDTIESVAKQTYKNIEIIIVDDCGTDNSMEVVMNYLNSYNLQAKIIKHKHNKGQSAARNTGLEASNGDYVYFLDSDDTIVPDCITKHVREIINKKAEFTIAPLKMEGYRQAYFSNTVIENNPYLSFLKGNFSPSACNRLYSSNFLKNNKFKFVEGIIYEDILWMYNVCRNSTKVALVHGDTYIYRVRENSTTTSTITSKNIQSMYIILRTLRQEYSESKIGPDCDKYFWEFFDRKRLISAISLFQYNVTNNQKREYYNKLQLLGSKRFNAYSLLLSMPWFLFRILLAFPYFIFKKYKKQ